MLQRLAYGFRDYVETLNELSRRYILGFDMELISNKMLDAFNLYRQTGDRAHLETASKYAACSRWTAASAALAVRAAASSTFGALG